MQRELPHPLAVRAFRECSILGHSKNQVRVLLVDDHAVVREGYLRLLERHGDIAVIGEAGDAATAHALFCSLDPQIVVMDISMPGTSGERSAG